MEMVLRGVRRKVTRPGTKRGVINMRTVIERRNELYLRLRTFLPAKIAYKIVVRAI